MGEIITKVKRKYKIEKTKIKKSEIIQNLKIIKAINSNKIRYADNIVFNKYFEKKIKEYEKNWEKETNEKGNVFKEINKMEAKYKKLKILLEECTNNIEKSLTKTKKFNEKATQKYTSEKTEKQIDDIKDLETKLTNKLNFLNALKNNLKTLRKYQKNIISTNTSTITPEYLKNKLKTIRKNFLNLTKTNNDGNHKIWENICSKSIALSNLISSINNNTTSKENFQKYFIDGQNYCRERLKTLANGDNAKKLENQLNDTQKIKTEKNISTWFKGIYENEKNNYDKKIPTIFNKNSAKEFTQQDKDLLIIFTLGFINCFYYKIINSAKKLYSDSQNLRKDVDKITDNLFKKGIKTVMPLVAGALGIAAAATGVNEALWLISAIGWIASQTPYYAMEIKDVIEDSLSNRSEGPDNNQITKMLEEIEQALFFPTPKDENITPS